MNTKSSLQKILKGILPSGVVAQVVEHMPSKCKIVGSNVSTEKKNNKRNPTF
jgi:hypothetical protein